MPNNICISIWLLIVATSTLAHKGKAEHANPEAILRDAQVAYAKGKYSSAASGLSKTSPVEQHFKGVQLKSALALLGSSRFLAGDKIKAKTTFKKLIYLDKNYELDPFDTPPPVLAFFEEQKTAVLKNLNRIEKIRQKKEPVVTAVTLKKPTLITLEKFMPLGYPQFARGATSKGIAIASLEGIAIGLNIGGYWWKRSLSETGNMVKNRADLHNYKIAQGLQIGGICLLAATFIYGVIDAFVEF